MELYVLFFVFMCSFFGASVGSPHPRVIDRNSPWGGLALANNPIFYNQPNPSSNGRPLLRFGFVARRGPRIKAQLFRARGGWRIIWGFIVGDARLGMGMHGNETEA